MPCGIEGEDPTLEQISEIRKKVSEHFADNPDAYDMADMARLQNDDKYVKRYFKHVFEKDGNQVDLAVKMIIAAFEWRKEFGVREISEENISEAMKQKGSLYIRNRDKDGKQMLIFQVRKHIKGAENVHEVKRFFIYLLEKIDREDDGDLITLVFDCSGCGLKNMDMEFVWYMINVFKDYYPWYLNYILVYDMPWVLNAAWKIIKSWMPASGVKKVKFLTKSNIGEYVAEDQRPVAWGGTDDWEYEWTTSSNKLNGFIESEDPMKKESVSFSGEVKQSDSNGSISSAILTSEAKPAANFNNNSVTLVNCKL